jgi:hypothetical protein
VDGESECVMCEWMGMGVIRDRETDGIIGIGVLVVDDGVFIVVDFKKFEKFETLISVVACARRLVTVA